MLDRLSNKQIYSIFFFIILVFTFFNHDIPFQYDDGGQLKYNLPIQDITNIKDVLFKSERASRVIYNITYSLDYFFGGKLFNFHFTNNLLHFLCTILSFKFLLLLFPDKRNVVLLSSLFFLIHPLSLQSVSYIMGRISLLLFIFTILPIYLHIKKYPTWVIILSLIGGYLSKSSTILNPFLIISYDLITTHSLTKTVKDNIKKYSWYILSIIFLLGLMYVYKNAFESYKGVANFSTFPFWEHLFFQVGNFAFSLYLFFNPAHQSIFHPYPDNIYNYMGFIITGGLLYISCIYFFFKSKDKHYKFLIFLFVISFSSNHSLLHFVNPFAEYRVYTALALFIFFFINFIMNKEIIKKATKGIILSLLFLYFFIFNILHIQQWKDPAKLWGYAFQNYPESRTVVINLLVSYMDRMDFNTPKELLKTLKKIVYKNPYHVKMFEYKLYFNEIIIRSVENDFVSVADKCIEYEKKHKLGFYSNPEMPYLCFLGLFLGDRFKHKERLIEYNNWFLNYYPKYLKEILPILVEYSVRQSLQRCLPLHLTRNYSFLDILEYKVDLEKFYKDQSCSFTLE